MAENKKEEKPAKEPKPKKVEHPKVIEAKNRVKTALQELRAARVAKKAVIDQFGA